jgi:hypothetical protein
MEGQLVLVFVVCRLFYWDEYKDCLFRRSVCSATKRPLCQVSCVIHWKYRDTLR